MQRYNGILRKLIRYGLWSAGAGTLAALLAFIIMAPFLPSVSELKDIQLQVPLRVYTHDGNLIAEYGEKRRAPLAYKEFPSYMVEAMISAEDARFFEHPGVDIQGLLRAVVTLVRTGEKAQGGSTITMQVARNFFLSNEKTYLRKINEIFLSFKIEFGLSKEEIMELYLNKIYLGHRAYGVAAAAQTYYGKELSELTLPQFAMIAGLPKAPSRYNPIVNPTRALARRNYVLQRMYELDYITEAEYEVARASRDDAELHSLDVQTDAPYVGEMVRAEMVSRYGDDAYVAGYKVYTTVNKRQQDTATVAVRNALMDYNTRHGYRGPLQHVDINMDKVSEQWIRVLSDKRELQQQLQEKGALGALVSTALELGHLRLGQQQWDQQLKSIPKVGNLVPALVSGVEEQAANIYLVDGRLARIDWKGLRWAARYESDVRTGPAPRKAADVLRPGDIVYVYQQEDGSWQLNYVPEAEGALISLNPHNGAIQALVGGFDFYQSKFNRALQAERQPGSNFKPFLYSAALERGYTPASIINDAPITKEDAVLEGVWRPENYSGEYRGPIRLRVALTNSVNTVAIRLLESIGVKYTLRHAARFGIPTAHLQKDLSLALGSGTVTPVDLATGYAVFANGGYRVFPYLIERIEDANGTVLYQANPVQVCAECLEEEEANNLQVSDGDTSAQADGPADTSTGPPSLALTPLPLQVDGATTDTTAATPAPQLPAPVYAAERVIPPQNAYLMTSMMRDVVLYGTGRRALSLGRRDLAGKTGTTNDQQDAWFSGFNHALVTTTWVGFDNPRPLGDRESGAQAALPMWIDYMKVALDGVPEEPLQVPPGMVTVRIDPSSGKLTGANNPNAVFETFREENLPTEDGPGQPYQSAEEGDKKEGSGANLTQQLF